MTYNPKLVKDAVDNLDCTHLEKLLGDLEKLSRYGQSMSTTAAKKKSIIDYVKFIIAKSVTEVVD